MRTADYIRISLELSAEEALALIDQMKDIPLTFPTANGGNRPRWILGHQAASEAKIIKEIMLGGEALLVHRRTLFGPGTVAIAEAAAYPAYDEVPEQFLTVRSHTLAVLDGLNGDDLDQPSRNCRAALQPILGTFGKCFQYVVFHFSYHAGQAADAHRTAGR